MLLDLKKRSRGVLLALLVLVSISFVFFYGNGEHARRLGNHISFWKQEQEFNGGSYGFHPIFSNPHSTRILYTPGSGTHYDDRVFYMLKTGAQTMQERLPVHAYTTLSQWWHTAVYGDIDATVNGIDVIGVFEDLPEDVLNSDEMSMYRVAKRSVQEQWEVPFTELDDTHGWDLDKYKNIPMLAHAYQSASPKIEWFVYADDDTFIHPYGFLNYLKTKYSKRQAVYLGSPAWMDIIPNKEAGIEGHTVAFAHGGSGVAINRKAMQKLFGRDPTDTQRIKEVVERYTRMTKKYCCGDAMVGIALYLEGEVEISAPWGLYPKKSDAFQGGNLEDFGIDDGSWCNPLFTWHHLSSQEIETLFEYDQAGAGVRRTVTYDDVYQQFFLPMLAEERADWDAGTDDMVEIDESYIEEHGLESYNTASGKTLAPHENKEDCVRICDLTNECLVWRWSNGTCHIALSSVRLGKASNAFSKDYTQPVHSGWNLTRIRQRRAKAKCDPLQFNSKTGEWNDQDGSTLSEGWFLRNLEKDKLDSEKQAEKEAEKEAAEKEAAEKEEAKKEEAAEA